MDLLWFDENQYDPSLLPKTRRFRSTEVATLRGGWHPNDVFIGIKRWGQRFMSTRPLRSRKLRFRCARGALGDRSRTGQLRPRWLLRPRDEVSLLPNEHD